MRLDDKLRFALGAEMGCQLTPEEVTAVAGWLVTLRRISKNMGGAPARQAREALGKYGDGL